MTDVTVASLAESLGYASESSFSHAFQRVLGVSPGRYRRAAHIEISARGVAEQPGNP